MSIDMTTMACLATELDMHTQEHLRQYWICSVCHLSGSIISISAMPCSCLLDRHKPGQYCKILCHDGELRPYSIINTPNSSRSVEFHIRIKISNRALMLEHFRIGNTLYLSDFQGNCVFDFNDFIPTVFIAEGLGMAAFFPIIESFSTRQEASLLWISRDEEQKKYHIHCKHWKNQFPKLSISSFDHLNNIEAVALNACFQYLQKSESVRVYFAGSHDLKLKIQSVLSTYIEKNQARFFSDV